MTPESWGGVLPITPATAQPIPPGTNATVRTFGLHPILGPVQSLFNHQRLAVVANVGTADPADHQGASTLPSSPPLPAQPVLPQRPAVRPGSPAPSKAPQVGWGGAMADLMAGGNGANAALHRHLAAGEAPCSSPADSVGQYAVNPGAAPANVVTATQASQPLRLAARRRARQQHRSRTPSSTSDFANDYATCRHPVDHRRRRPSTPPSRQGAAATIRRAAGLHQPGHRRADQPPGPAAADRRRD